MRYPKLNRKQEQGTKEKDEEEVEEENRDLEEDLPLTGKDTCWKCFKSVLNGEYAFCEGNYTRHYYCGPCFIKSMYGADSYVARDKLKLNCWAPDCRGKFADECNLRFFKKEKQAKSKINKSKQPTIKKRVIPNTKSSSFIKHRKFEANRVSDGTKLGDGRNNLDDITIDVKKQIQSTTNQLKALDFSNAYITFINKRDGNN